MTITCRAAKSTRCRCLGTAGTQNSRSPCTTIIVCAGVIWLRYKRPDLPRPFRSPFVPFFPLCGIVLSLFLSTVGLGPYTWLRFIVWLAVGLIIYFGYGFRQPHPDAARTL